MVNISPRGLLGLACLNMAILVQPISSSSSSATQASSSPSADASLICSTIDPSDCYPRLFQPTKDFQPIKEGQDIPPGLHVRLNIWSGEREARLNIPMEGDEGASLDGIPEEQAMIIVEQPTEDDLEPEQTALRDRVPDQPPPYDPVGKVLPPPPSQAGGEIGTFHQAMTFIGVEARAFDKALDDLTELSHDIYYGVEIAKNGPVLEKLVCLTLGLGSEKFPADKEKRDHKAASILASMSQNNPKALEEVAKLWRLVMYPNCGTELMETKTKTSGKGNFVTVLRNRLGREKEPTTFKAKVTAISGLLKEPLIRDDFLQNGGMEVLLAIWLKKGEQWDGVRRKVAQLAIDNFLDESMGAAVGVWPTRPLSEDKICETKGRMLEEGCWEYHIAGFTKANPDASWGTDFLKVLREQRARHGDSIQDREL